MEPLENINNNDHNLEIGELSSQTPVGWSSVCLDQTISYYIDCNTVNIETEEDFDNINNNF